MRLRLAILVLGATVLAACGADDALAPAVPGGTGTLPPDARTIRCSQDFGDTIQSAYTPPFLPGHTYRLIQGACVPNPAWGHHDWLAYDFDLAIGDTVIASRGGTVIWTEESYEDATRICGQENGVFIRHDDGTVMQYFHFTRHGVLASRGDVVEAGEPIGLSGDSGCSSGPHLHVALFRDATSFDVENNIPASFRKLQGPLTTKHSLIQDQLYTALP